MPRSPPPSPAHSYGTARWRALALVLAALLGACSSAPRRISEPSTAASPGAPGAAASGPATSSAAAAALLRAALDMLGQPYHWGGAAPGGFDCSGLVWYAAQRAGIELPRTAKQQFESGTPIERHEVHAGDLVFMRLRSKELHVGIALDEARFVNAPAHGGVVRIDRLDRPPYAQAYLRARRLEFTR